MEMGWGEWMCWGCTGLPHAQRWGKMGSGLPVLSCERQTFGRVITRRTALGVISDSCLLKVFGALSLYGPRLPYLRLMFRLDLHQEESCMCQHKQYALKSHCVHTWMCFTDAVNIYLSTEIDTLLKMPLPDFPHVIMFWTTIHYSWRILISSNVI